MYILNKTYFEEASSEHSISGSVFVMSVSLEHLLVKNHLLWQLNALFISVCTGLVFEMR
jgi:hypothetical protein